MGSWLLNFIQDRRVASFDLFDVQNTLKITQSVMPKPVYLLTVQEAHKEYNSLTDQIRTKYGQLDSGEYGVVGTPAFNAEAYGLAHLFAHVSQLCQKTEPANSKGNYIGPHSSSIEETFRIKITLGRQFV